MEQIKRYKYPRTYHLPWSPGLKNDDRVIESLEPFIGQEVVATVKLDGENATIGHNYYHARSLEKEYHASRTWVNRLQGEIGYLLEPNERICGENVAAHHSIKYENLEHFFYAFSYWIDDICQSWDDTVKKCEELGLITVPVLYKGIWDEEIIKKLFTKYHNGDKMEGYVVRTAAQFSFSKKFIKEMAKYVRAGHVQTDKHWKKKPVVWNNWRK